MFLDPPGVLGFSIFPYHSRVLSHPRPLDPPKVLVAFRILGLVFLVCLPKALFLFSNNHRDIENYFLRLDCPTFY